MTGSDQAHWARVAADWIAWARAPGHDAFWHYRAGLAALIGPGTGEALDVGCGEGRVSRLLGELGYRVTAADAVAEMVAAARETGSAAEYAIAAVDFAGWARPLPVYAAALRRAGFAITDLREPRPDPGDLPPHIEGARRAPVFLWMAAEPHPA